MSQPGHPRGKGAVCVLAGSVVSKDTAWPFPPTMAGCQNSSCLSVEDGGLGCLFVTKVITYQSS